MTGRTATYFLAAAMAILLLLVGLAAAAAEPHVGGADGMPPQQGVMRRALTTASDNACAAESDACAVDTACFACLTVFAAALDRCDPGDQVTCSEAQEAVCCTIAEEKEDCESNDLFGTFIECVWEEANAGTGCEVDVSSDCSGATGCSSSWGVSAGLYSAAVAGILVAAFGVVV